MDDPWTLIWGVLCVGFVAGYLLSDWSHRKERKLADALIESLLQKITHLMQERDRWEEEGEWWKNT